MGYATVRMFQKGFDAIAKSNNAGRSNVASVISSVLRYPIRAFAAFLVAPLLIVRIALLAKNPIRRIIAVFGLIVALGLAYLAGTFLGSIAGALLIATKLGPLIALGFFVGTTFSVVLSVAFSIVVLNATSWLFVGLSSEEVLDYLKSISE